MIVANGLIVATVLIFPSGLTDAAAVVVSTEDAALRIAFRCIPHAARPPKPPSRAIHTPVVVACAGRLHLTFNSAQDTRKTSCTDVTRNVGRWSTVPKSESVVAMTVTFASDDVTCPMEARGRVTDLCASRPVDIGNSTQGAVCMSPRSAVRALTEGRVSL